MMGCTLYTFGSGCDEMETNRTLFSLFETANNKHRVRRKNGIGGIGQPRHHSSLSLNSRPFDTNNQPKKGKKSKDQQQQTNNSSRKQNVRVCH